MNAAFTPQAKERVLSTLNVDGSRRWLEPRLSRGRFLRWRTMLAWFLIAIFAIAPYIKVGGKPLILLDIIHRRFTLAGTTYLATDTVLLMLLMIGIFVSIFLVTALFGRVWCGWACPQTVYLEFVFRPLERFFARRRMKLMRLPVYIALSAVVAHIFLAYFVGVESLWLWVRSSPVEHPTAFLMMLGVTGLMFFDFAYFREQTCLVACPYGRLQSVLFDQQTLIVGYDARRGEPRGKLKQTGAGDCIDCKLCVKTCPTGIDIRDGLQMECIGCTQCIDACDAVMDKVGKPRGLIRYTSSADLKGLPRRLWRVRVVLYPLVLIGVVIALVTLLSRDHDADVTVLRATGAPFTTLPDGTISNSIRIKITNRTDQEQKYDVHLIAPASGKVLSAEIPVIVPAGETRTASAFVVVAPDVLVDGSCPIDLQIADGAHAPIDRRYLFLGPRPE